MYGCCMSEEINGYVFIYTEQNLFSFSRHSLNPWNYSRLGIGCEANTNLFAGEKEEDNLRTLDPVTNKRANNKETKLTNRRGSCTINASSSWYIGCLGKKVLLGLHTRRFLLQWRRQRNAYSIKVRIVLVLVKLLIFAASHSKWGLSCWRSTVTVFWVILAGHVQNHL